MMNSTSSSERTGSSPIATLNTVKKGLPGVVLTLNDHSTVLDRHDADIAGHDTRIKRLSDENKALRDDLDKLDKMLFVQEKTMKNLQTKFEGLEAAYAAMREREREKEGSDSSEEESEVEDGTKRVSERERAAMEASEAAYRDNSIKELTRLSYMFLMGIGKLTADGLPWYPEDPDKNTWPRVVGTRDPVLRFRWDEPLSHDDNYYSMRMKSS
ncbi:hypothetical protein C0992_009409, partial [Termitomyces sp. T32_za158]